MSSPPTVESTKQEIAAYYRVNYRDFLSHRKRLKDSGDITKAWDRLYDAFRSHCTNLKKKGEKRKLEYKDEWPNYVSKNFLQSSDGEGEDGEVHPPAPKRSPRHALPPPPSTSSSSLSLPASPLFSIPQREDEDAVSSHARILTNRFPPSARGFPTSSSSTSTSTSSSSPSPFLSSPEFAASDADHLTPPTSSLFMEDCSGGLAEVADADLGHPVPIDEWKSNDNGGGALQPKRAEVEQKMEDDQRELEETIAQLRNQLAEAVDHSSRLDVDLRQLTTQLQREQDLRTASDIAMRQLSTQLADANATFEAARSQAQDGEICLQTSKAEADALRRDLESHASQRQLMEQLNTQQAGRMERYDQELADARRREESLSRQVNASACELQAVQIKAEQSFLQGYIMRACDEFVLDCPLYRGSLRQARVFAQISKERACRVLNCLRDSTELSSKFKYDGCTVLPTSNEREAGSVYRKISLLLHADRLPAAIDGANRDVAFSVVKVCVERMKLGSAWVRDEAKASMSQEDREYEEEKARAEAAADEKRDKEERRGQARDDDDSEDEDEDEDEDENDDEDDDLREEKEEERESRRQQERDRKWAQWERQRRQPEQAEAEQQQQQEAKAAAAAEESLREEEWRQRQAREQEARVAAELERQRAIQRERQRERERERERGREQERQAEHERRQHHESRRPERWRECREESSRTQTRSQGGSRR